VRTETRDAFKFKFKFSSVEGGSLEMPGASTSKGRVAPALGLPADETLFDARGVILLTHAPQTGVSIFEALLEARMYVCMYSTTPRNGNRTNGNHLDQSLSSPQKNGN
jgi:hypothetical protein